DDRGQHCVCVERRVHRLAHLAKCSKLLYRLGQLAAARLHLIEQAHILDGNYGLVSENLEKRDLFVTEGANLVPPQLNVTDRDAFAQKRDAERSPMTEALGKRTAFRIFDFLGLKVLDVDQAPINYRPSAYRSAMKRNITDRHWSMMADKAQHVIVCTQDDSIEGIAQPCSATSNSVEYWLNVGRRAADYVEHLGGRHLVFELLCQFARACLHFVEQPHVLDGDHRLIGKGLGKLDLLRRIWPGFGSPDSQHTNQNSLA